MTDPHDRPYTFGWHGEIIRRETTDAERLGLSINGWSSNVTDLPKWMQVPALGRDMRPLTLLAARAVLASDWLVERDRAIAERAWDECLQAISWAIEHGPWEHAIPYVAKNNPHRKDADQ